LTYCHSSSPLFEQVTSLYAAFRKLRQHKVIRQAVRGGVWFFQIKVSKKSGEYHPHLHIVLDSDYVSQKLISLQWLQSTGNSFIVDIRAVKSPEVVADYVSRYAARPCNLSDFTPEQGVDVVSLFHRRRLCGTFGTGRSVKLGHKKMENFDQWCRIGSWSQIVNMTVRPDCCRRIIDAWFNDTCVSDSDCPDFSLIEVQKKYLGDISSLDIDSFFHKYEGFG
jgi:hypothetical protein